MPKGIPPDIDTQKLNARAHDQVERHIGIQHSGQIGDGRERGGQVGIQKSQIRKWLAGAMQHARPHGPRFPLILGQHQGTDPIGVLRPHPLQYRFGAIGTPIVDKAEINVRALLHIR